MSGKSTQTRLVLESKDTNVHRMAWAWKFNRGKTEPATLFVSCACGKQQHVQDPADVKACICGVNLAEAELKNFEPAPKPEPVKK